MGEQQQRGNTQSGVATAMMTTPLTLASAVASYDLNLEIPFVFGCKEAKETAVGYTELALPSSNRFISLYSWACSICPLPPVLVMTKKRQPLGWRDGS